MCHQPVLIGQIETNDGIKSNTDDGNVDGKVEYNDNDDDDEEREE